MALVTRSLLVVLALVLLSAGALAWDEDEAPAAQGQTVAAPVELQPADLPSKAETRELLSEILAQPEFTKDGRDEEPQESLLQKFNDWLNRLFGNSLQLGGLGWPGVGLIIALLITVIYLLVRLYLGLSGRRDAQFAAAELEQLPATAEALIALSKEAAAAGDFRRAVRLLFNAAVKSLDMPASSLQTNYQVLAFTRRNHLAAETSLRKLIMIFEDVWYGASPCGQAEFSQSEELYRNFSASLYREGS